MPGAVQLFQVVRAAHVFRVCVSTRYQSLGARGSAQCVSSVATVILSPPLPFVIISDQRDKKVPAPNAGLLLKVPVPVILI